MIDVVTLIAYLNPGTGSLVLQFLLVGIAGAWITCRTYGHKITKRFVRKKSTRLSPKPDGR